MLLEEEASDPLVSGVRLRLSSSATPKAELSELVKVRSIRTSVNAFAAVDFTILFDVALQPLK